MFCEEKVFTAKVVAAAAIGQLEVEKQLVKMKLDLRCWKYWAVKEFFGWLMCVKKFGKTPKEWQTGVIIPIFKKRDCKQCTNYRELV